MQKKNGMIGFGFDLDLIWIEIGVFKNFKECARSPCNGNHFSSNSSLKESYLTINPLEEYSIWAYWLDMMVADWGMGPRPPPPPPPPPPKKKTLVKQSKLS